MKLRQGLQFEVIVNLLLLMAAALLFSGFLLLKLAERELVRQRVEGVREHLQLIAAGIAAPGSGPADEETRARQLRRALTVVQAQAWFLADNALNLRASGFSGPDLPVRRDDLQRALGSREPVVTLDYPSSWLPWSAVEEPQVTVSLGLPAAARGEGVLQARFSLTDVRQRIGEARSVFLIYVGLYGLVLFLFGLWLLHKSVIAPVRSLIGATRQVAAGDLEPVLPVTGPAEFTTLATSFNAMTAALKESRNQSEDHIRSLQTANEDLRLTRAELIRTEKLASVGRLAAGMAHEIGNPLGAVIAYLELLRGRVADPPTQEIVVRTQAEAARIDRLVRDLLDYAAPERSVPERFDLRTVLAEAEELLRHQGALDGIEVRSTMPPVLPQVSMGRHKLLQVVVNLLLNARDAAPGGVVQLAAGSEGDSVWFSVADNGPGIDAAIREQIFDPFFTTKAPGRGRGLGLSVCHRIIEEAGGTLALVDTAATGCTFRVRLPAAKEVP